MMGRWFTAGVVASFTAKPDAYDRLTADEHPMISKTHGATYADHNMDGIYYNGGSWMRIGICGYVAGKLHGWSKADQAIANRLWAEINISQDFPTSQEYLATDPAHPFFGYHRVFAWNAFVLMVMEMAGLRRPRNGSGLFEAGCRMKYGRREPRPAHFLLELSETP